jgi:hypothetical protein
MNNGHKDFLLLFVQFTSSAFHLAMMNQILATRSRTNVRFGRRPPLLDRPDR